MDYETIQTVRREIKSGRIHAPAVDYTFPPLLLIKRKRKERGALIHLRENTNDGWDEGGFQDDFYGDVDDTNDIMDVTPNYFRECEQLDTTFSTPTDMPHNFSLRPLFQGSKYSAKDLARFLLSFKARHLKVGDGILANIVAMMATFLPPDNLFKSRLPETTSTYFLLKTLDNLAAYETNLRCLQIDVCVKKCMGYYSTNEGCNFCDICGECRWKLCTPACYNGNKEKLCDHLQRPRSRVYYNVVQDRLVKLLKSDLKNLFNYQYHRGGEYIYFDLYMSLNVFICL